MNAPCKNCERCGCGAYHSQCKEYLRFKEDCVAEKQALRLLYIDYKVRRNYHRPDYSPIKRPMR